MSLISKAFAPDSIFGRDSYIISCVPPGQVLADEPYKPDS